MNATDEMEDIIEGDDSGEDELESGEDEAEETDASEVNEADEEEVGDEADDADVDEDDDADEDDVGDEDEDQPHVDEDDADDEDADADDASGAKEASAKKPGPQKAEKRTVSEEHLKTVLESLIFVSNRPVSDRQLARAAKARVAEVRPILEQLKEEYLARGIHLVQVSGGYQFRSSAQNAPFVRDFVAKRPVRLTRAQLETLAIVAYRQPVTRPEIEDIRGVDSGSASKVLLERNLLKILGRKDEPGRPMLYGTSPFFLEFFGMTSLTDLPTLKEFSELSEESRSIFERKLGEPLDLDEAAREAAEAESAAQEEMLNAFSEDDEGEGRDDDDDDDDNDDNDSDDQEALLEQFVGDADDDDDDDSDDDDDDDSDDDDDDDSDSDDSDSDDDDDDRVHRGGEEEE